MKIGVISDTHLTASKSGMFGGAAQKLRSKVTLDELRAMLERHFSGVELILHAGDFVEIAVAEMLEQIAPLTGVQGNMDLPDIQRRFPVKTTVTAQGVTIGLIHGSGAPHGLADRVAQEFEGVNAIVFGHSHQPMNEARNGVLFFNPGSPTDRIFAPYHSVGILHLDDTLRGEIIRLSS